MSEKTTTFNGNNGILLYSEGQPMKPMEYMNLPQKLLEQTFYTNYTINMKTQTQHRRMK